MKWHIIIRSMAGWIKSMRAGPTLVTILYQMYKASETEEMKG